MEDTRRRWHILFACGAALSLVVCLCAGNLSAGTGEEASALQVCAGMTILGRDLGSGGVGFSDSSLIGELVDEIQINDSGIWASSASSRRTVKQRHVEFSSNELDVDGLFVVQKVDGWAVGLEESYTNMRRLTPRLYGWQLYSITGHHWLYEFTFEQPLFSPFSFSFGASLYEKTDSFEGDEDRICRDENSLAAAFLKRDYRDYYRRVGTSAFVSQQLLGDAKLKVEYRDDDIESLTGFRSIWTVFRKNDYFDRNRRAEEGRMVSVVGTFEFDSRPDEEYPSGGFWHRAYLEHAGQGLGGDFDFTRWKIDVRNYLKLSGSHFLDYRLMAGGMLGPEEHRLPPQKRFAIGGLGTLRAHDFKSLQGDEMLLINVEYGLEVESSLEALVFLDAGNAWDRSEPFFDQQLDLDGGVGLRSSDGNVGLYFARDLRADDRRTNVTFRVDRTF